MSELTVTTLSPDVLPPILFDELNDLANLHLRVAMECRLTLELSDARIADVQSKLIYPGYPISLDIAEAAAARALQRAVRGYRYILIKIYPNRGPSLSDSFLYQRNRKRNSIRRREI